MPRLIEGAFTRYEFSEDEIIAASALTPMQRAFIQNEAAIAAERLLDLEFDPDKPLKFAQEEAGLKGQRAAYEFLLTADLRAQEFAAAARQAAQATGNAPDQDPSALGSLFNISPQV